MKKINFCIIFLLTLQRLQAAPEVYTPAQLRLLERHEELRKTHITPDRMAVVKKVDQALPTIISGDFTPIDQAAAAGDLEMMWGFFSELRVPIGLGEFYKKYGRNDEATAKYREFNDRVSAYVNQKLAAIPGHAKMQADRVEVMSQEAGFFDLRTGPLMYLGELGSMEAIQQLGRFLDDERNPEGRDWPMISDGDDFKYKGAPSNADAAIPAMHKALGNLSPAGPEYMPPDRKKLQDWWKSDAAKPYREWSYATGEPMPPPRPRAAPLLPPLDSKAIVADQSNSAADETVKPWMLGVMLLACIIAATMLAAKKKLK